MGVALAFTALALRLQACPLTLRFHSQFATLYQEAKVYARLKERRGGYQHFLQFYGLVHTNGIPSIALERGQVVSRLWLRRPTSR